MRHDRELLAWALDRFWPKICLATSFGPQSIVLMHWISELRPSTTIFYLDTGLLFPQTYALRDTLSARFGMRFVRVPATLTLAGQSARYGPALWNRNPDLCCRLRKVAPLRSFLVGHRAWITGIRRAHSSSRASARSFEWDSANGLIKVNPLVRWSREEVWSYLKTHDLPSNPLHLEGYPSVGCQPCTRPAGDSADSRAGRWAGQEKTECGIHLSTPHHGSSALLPIVPSRREA